MNSLNMIFKYGIFCGIVLAWNTFFFVYDIYNVVYGSGFTMTFVLCGAFQLLLIFKTVLTIDEVLNHD